MPGYAPVVWQTYILPVELLVEAVLIPSFTYHSQYHVNLCSKEYEIYTIYLSRQCGISHMATTEWMKAPVPKIEWRNSNLDPNGIKSRMWKHTKNIFHILIFPSQVNCLSSYCPSFPVRVFVPSFQFYYLVTSFKILCQGENNSQKKKISTFGEQILYYQLKVGKPRGFKIVQVCLKHENTLY